MIRTKYKRIKSIDIVFACMLQSLAILAIWAGRNGKDPTSQPAFSKLLLSVLVRHPANNVVSGVFCPMTMFFKWPPVTVMGPDYIDFQQ